MNLKNISSQVQVMHLPVSIYYEASHSGGRKRTRGSVNTLFKEVISDQIIIERLPDTFKKSGGDIDWDYGFLKGLVKFADIDPKNTLLSIRYFLLDQAGNLNQHRKVPLFHLDNELKDALEIIVKRR